MTDIHYYPVVDCDPKGTEKIALCMCKDEKTVRESHAMWLAEVVPHYFRLKARNRLPLNTPKYKIRCPLCNKHLRPVTKRASDTTLELYVCSSCVADSNKGGSYYGR